MAGSAGQPPRTCLRLAGQRRAPRWSTGPATCRPLSRVSPLVSFPARRPGRLAPFAARLVYFISGCSLPACFLDAPCARQTGCPRQQLDGLPRSHTASAHLPLMGAAVPPTPAGALLRQKRDLAALSAEPGEGDAGTLLIPREQPRAR